MAPTYKLSYFNVAGAAEPIRYLFSYGGIAFEDNRVEREDWPKLKPSTPFGQMPILEYNGKMANQSVAIARYVAKQVKLVGKDDWENMEIDATVDTLNDLKNKFVQYHFEEDEKAKEARKQVLFNETVPFYLTRLDAQAAKNKGYIAIGRLTWADLFAASFFEQITNLIKVDIIASYPNLIKVRDTVLELPSIKAWIAKHPKTK